MDIDEDRSSDDSQNPGSLRDFIMDDDHPNARSPEAANGEDTIMATIGKTN
jgi:hypothetical protein